jgi:hypothetical protein
MAGIDIQCLCGAIKMRLSGEPLAQFYCHCEDCQLAHGAAYVPCAQYRTACAELIAGQPLFWRVRVTPRATCPECGTRVFAEPPGLGVRGILAHLLPKGMFKPKFHVQCQHAWLPVKDDLPHYKGFPRLFGGSDEQVLW